MSLQRISLSIKVLGLGSQRAEALASLKPPELIAEILQEFRDELPYLGTQPEDYTLCLASSTFRLDEQLPLNEQNLGNNPSLILEERPVNLPIGASALSKAAYFREPNSGQVYRLRWQPAIIGRPYPGKNDEALLGVNLENLPDGRKISRRQACLTEKNGQFFIKNLSSNNPFLLNTATNPDRRFPIEDQEHPIQDKDQLWMGSDSLCLTFLEINF